MPVMVMPVTDEYLYDTCDDMLTARHKTDKTKSKSNRTIIQKHEVKASASAFHIVERFI
jgi:hypothetical protein